MNTDFIDCKVSDVFENNIYDLNPHLKYLPIYKDIFSRDKSKDKIKSSNEMWAIFILESFDEETNKYLAYPIDLRLQVIKEKEINIEDELWKKARERYSIDLMSKAEKSLKAIYEQLDARKEFLDANPYTVQWYDIDEHGKPMKAGNTLVPKYLKPAEKDKMVLETEDLYNALKRSQDLFVKDKNNRRVVGGRNESLSEQGKL